MILLYYKIWTSSHKRAKHLQSQQIEQCKKHKRKKKIKATKLRHGAILKRHVQPSQTTSNISKSPSRNPPHLPIPLPPLAILYATAAQSLALIISVWNSLFPLLFIQLLCVKGNFLLFLFFHSYRSLALYALIVLNFPRNIMLCLDEKQDILF